MLAVQKTYEDTFVLPHRTLLHAVALSRWNGISKKVPDGTWVKQTQLKSAPNLDLHTVHFESYRLQPKGIFHNAEGCRAQLEVGLMLPYALMALAAANAA